MMPKDFEPIGYEDLDKIKKMQPEGWSDFYPVFRFYIDSPFCHPIKTVSNGRIEGIGVSVRFGKTNWLAHIIVNETCRNRGVGRNIVNLLIQDINPAPSDSVLLIATSLGEPVYRKAGFKIVTEYVFLKREKSLEMTIKNPHLVPCDKKYEDRVLEMDAAVSGESRRPLLESHLKNAVLFVKMDQVQGYYLPGLGEGLIVGETPEAGLALMALKYDTADKAVLPASNTTGIEFLKKRGFYEISRAPRMILGTDISWQPEKIYSRIGGNFG